MRLCAALRRRGSLPIWFDPTMTWLAARTGNRGHPETFSESAIQTCLTLKVLFGLPLRQTVGLVASLIEMAGPDWPVSGLFDALPTSGTDLRCRSPAAVQTAPSRCLSTSSHGNATGSGDHGEVASGSAVMASGRHVSMVPRAAGRGARSILAMDTTTGDIRAALLR